MTTEPTSTDDPADTASAAHIEAMCNAWVAWSRTRRYYGPPPLSAGVLGKLTRKGGPRRAGGPDAFCSAELAAFNLAVQAQPDDTERKVFLLHHLYAVADIKVAAAALGISKATWYRMLHRFEARAYAAHHRILAANLAELEAMPHKTATATA